MKEIFSLLVDIVFLSGYWAFILFVLYPILLEIYFFISAHRLSELFIANKKTNKIHQGIGRSGRKLILNHRKKYKYKSIELKLYGMAKLVDSQAKLVLKSLQLHTRYTTYTHKHMKKLIKKGANQGYLKIHHISTKKQRYTFLESLSILGLKDTFKIFLSDKYRHHLYKQFYEITFTRIQ